VNDHIVPRNSRSSGAFTDHPSTTARRDLTPEQLARLERQVNYIIDDCFFTIGQIVGARKSLDYETVIWWRDHYRMKFLAAMRTFGDRWAADRHNVTAVAIMLAERAVRYAGDNPSIDKDAAEEAALDVERYCTLHSRRAARTRGLDPSDGRVPLIAGYWCADFPNLDWPGDLDREE
jgi:hypothetical protein